MPIPGWNNLRLRARALLHRRRLDPRPSMAERCWAARGGRWFSGPVPQSGYNRLRRPERNARGVRPVYQPRDHSPRPMSSTEYHEPIEFLSEETRDMHRAIVSAIEELEAIDWYQQRADAVKDDHMKQILLHNKDEEVEHFLMTLEWIRRKMPKMDEEMRKYLFTEGPIHELEHAETGGGGEDKEDGAASLGIGSLK